MSPYLFVGLGNPGFRYCSTRHNIGFRSIDCLAGSYTTSGLKYCHSLLGEVSKETISGRECFFIKPDTYMHHVGKSVKLAKEYLAVPSESVFLIFDDIDLPFGRLKLLFGEGGYEHEGVSSVVQELESEKFYRICVGVGKPLHGSVVNYLLEKFLDEEQSFIQNEFGFTLENLFKTIIEKGPNEAMNNFNLR